MTCKGATATNGTVDGNGNVSPTDPIIISDVVDGNGNTIPLPTTTTNSMFTLSIFHWLLILLAVVIIAANLLQKKDPPYNIPVYQTN